MLKIENLVHVYPNGTRALDGLTLDIPPGMFGLLGPNGAGKSTLMRTISTLQVPTSGSIHFDEIDVLADPGALRRTLGYLPQDFGVYPRVSAYDMLDHLAVLKGYGRRGERRAVVEALLNQVNLWQVRDKAIAGFSGGMRQRFGIAQALIGQPRLVIVDEPTAGLDPEESNRFLNLLAEISEKVVVIFSTHIVQDIADLCQNNAIIASGRIIRTKTIDKGALEGHRRDYDVITTRLSGGRTVIHALADADPGNGFVPIPGDLEDVYCSTLLPLRRAA